MEARGGPPGPAQLNQVGDATLGDVLGRLAEGVMVVDASGRILVRNGSTYSAATNFYYSAAQTYKIKMVVNPATKTYSVYAQAPGGAETLIASNYAFRTEQASVSQLDNWVMNQSVAGATLSACNFTVQ